MSSIEYRKRQRDAGKLPMTRSLAEEYADGQDTTEEVHTSDNTGESEAAELELEVEETEVVEPAVVETPVEETTIEVQGEIETPVAEIETPADAEQPQDATSRTPQQLRETAIQTVDALAGMSAEDYESSLQSLESSDPVLYKVVLDEIKNTNAGS